MNTARKLFLRTAKQVKWQRSLASCASAKNDFLIHSPLPEIEFYEGRFMDRLWRDAAGFQDHVAVECATTRKNYTYKQLTRNMAAFATSLHKKLGLKKGDVVGAMLPNSPEFTVVAFGTLQAGCTLTTVNPIYKEYEVAHQVSTTEPKVMITIPECLEIVIKGLNNAKSNAKIVLIDRPGTTVPSNVIKYSEIAENAEVDYKLLDKIENKPEDVAFIPFSSGTTGLPKGVDITHKNLLAAIEMMHVKESCYPRLTHGDFQDVVPCILPFFHIYGLVVTLIGHLGKGCKLVAVPKFTAGLYFDILEKDKPSLLYIVPPIAILLGKHPDVKREYFQNVRNIVCGAAPLSGSDVEAVLEKSQKDIEFNQGFGTTETTSLVTSTYVGSKVLDYSASGMPMASTTLKFVDPLTGNPVPIGESGELYVKSHVVMKGYHRNEKATKESITEDGFFKTGDLGHFIPGKGLFITERIKELIKVKGMQVAPAELESILRSHPAVQEAAVIGVPHDFYGEAPKAFVIKKPSSNTSEEELQDFVAGKVASFKKIEEVVFVNDIPKTSSGKILRKDLKKMYA
ncbi:AMP-binding enzyme domain-containing protein [Phthorimaea operculella]|nr:AMP-binding enzyme domain-containing protein [Phthorimaea operculella]